MRTHFKNKLRAAALSATLLTLAPMQAHETEVQYLSGTGLGHTKTWRFFCSGGMNSGKWSKIEVPSQWELQGFGEYTFGRFYLKKGAKPSSETGIYVCDFKAPAEWQDRQVELVFEGVMTDTEAFVNGQKAGDTHQGGFYAFSYDITDKLKFGKKNELRVNVSKESADASVNKAERRADWWLFGGIYRPVYLRVKPKMNISRIAVDARADGRLNTVLYTTGLTDGCKAAFSLTSVDGTQTLARQVVTLDAAAKQTVSTQWQGVRLWDCEHPNLYNLQVELIGKDGQTVHTHRERIGFRTVEFRPQDGFYVNGTKIILKGINRHCFYPDGGRTTNKELSVSDVKFNRGNGGKFDGKFFDKQVYNLGLTFSFPEAETKGMSWFGRGPYRVWKNRIPGTNYGVWQKDYNNTITGESFSNLVYPEFKGYHANLYWATIDNTAAPFTVYSETDGIYLCLFKPEYPENRRPGENKMQEYPIGDISFLYDIQAMRSFKPISEHGPLSQPSSIRIKQGDDGLHLRLWFDFR